MRAKEEVVWHAVRVVCSSLERQSVWWFGAERQREIPWEAAAWRRLLAVSAVDRNWYRALKEPIDLKQPGAVMGPLSPLTFSLLHRVGSLRL